MKIAVIALGKIGLPLAVQFASKGHEVIGVDVNQATVDLINSGLEPFPGEDHLAEKLAELVPAGALRATTSYADAVPGADAVVLVVPLFVDDEARPDFGWMDDATSELAAHLTADTLVAYETTLPVGTTRTLWKPMLEEGSGLVEGTDFHLVFSPERVLTGRVFADLRKYPKLVGGLSEAGAARAIAFYDAVLDFDDRPDLPRGNGVWDLGSAEAAEMAKLAETTYRDVNIGLANQFAKYADKINIDIYKVIQACNSQPFSHIHQPGIAVGGHCIPVYPHFYLQGDPSATVVRAARDANLSMPAHAVDLVEAALGNLQGKVIVILGLAYRGGVKEHSFSGTWSLVSEIESRGGIAKVHDPLFSSNELQQLGLTPTSTFDDANALILQTDHNDYATLTPDKMSGASVFLDGRNAAPESIRNSHLHYLKLGAPVPGWRRAKVT